MIVQTKENLEYITYSPKTQAEFETAIRSLAEAGFTPYEQGYAWTALQKVFIAFNLNHSQGAPLYIVGGNINNVERVNDVNIDNITDFVDTADDLFLKAMDGDKKKADFGKEVARALFSDSDGVLKMLAQAFMGGAR